MALEVVREFLPQSVEIIHEYGCFRGNGTAFLKRQLGAKTAVGFDVDDDHLCHARKNAPDCEFRFGRVQEATEAADVIFVLHVLEPDRFVPEPKGGVIANLLGRCRWLVLGIHPWDGANTMSWVSPLISKDPDVICAGYFGREIALDGRTDLIVLLRGKLGKP